MAIKKLKRREVSLPDDIARRLEAKAKADGRKLKPYMEKVLSEHVKPARIKE